MAKTNDTAALRTHAWGTQPGMFGPRLEHRLAMFTRETAKLPCGSRLLDAAVGLGQLAARLVKQGHRVVGVDSSFDAALYAKMSAGLSTVVADLTLLPFRDGVFDAITSGETLEHLDDDELAVEELGRVVRARGICVATVPALRALWTKSDDYYGHKRRYDRGELTALFERASFIDVTTSFWGFPMVLAYDYLFLLPMNLRRAKHDVASDAALRGAASAARSGLLVRLVRALFSLDRLFAFVPFGPGLVLVGTKR